ncbi:MAG: acyl-CoA-binding protein [Flavobacteriales bacterium]|nr:acyl-CoA-binding protein [Flavobacteriales bacterium]
MNKGEAIKNIESAVTLNEKFEAAYDVLKHSPPISQDKMLLLYAYYKQSVFGDYKHKEFSNSLNNYIQTFKNNAWSQVIGTSKEDAMKKYIKLTTIIVEEEY